MSLDHPALRDFMALPARPGGPARAAYKVLPETRESPERPVREALRVRPVFEAQPDLEAFPDPKETSGNRVPRDRLDRQVRPDRLVPFVRPGTPKP